MHYFSLHFHQPWNRAANGTIRMQNSLPLRNLVNYPPHTGNHEQETGISEVDKNRLEAEGLGRTVINLESWEESRVLRGANYTPVPGTECNGTLLSLRRTVSASPPPPQEPTLFLKIWAMKEIIHSENVLLGEGAVTVPCPRRGLFLFLAHFLSASNKAPGDDALSEQETGAQNSESIDLCSTRQGLYLGTGYNLAVPFVHDGRSWEQELICHLSMILFWWCC